MEVELTVPFYDDLLFQLHDLFVRCDEVGLGAKVSRQIALLAPNRISLLMRYLSEAEAGGTPEMEREDLAAAVVGRMDDTQLSRARVLLKKKGYGRAAAAASGRMVSAQPDQIRLLAQYLQDLLDGCSDQDRQELATAAIERIDSADLPRVRTLLKRQGFGLAAASASRRMAAEQPALLRLLMLYLQDVRDGTPEAEREDFAAAAVGWLDSTDLPRVRTLLKKQGFFRAAAAASRRMAAEQPAQTPLLLQYLQDLLDGSVDQERDALAAAAVETMDGVHLPRARALLKKKGCDQAALAASRRMAVEQPGEERQFLYLRDLLDGPDQDRDASAAAAIAGMDITALPRAHALLKKRGCVQAAFAASRRMAAEAPAQSPFLLLHLQDLLEAGPDTERDDSAVSLVERMDGGHLARARLLLKKHGCNRAALLASRRMAAEQPAQTQLLLLYLQDLLDAGPQPDQDELAAALIERLDGESLPRTHALLKARGCNRAALAASRRMAVERPQQTPPLLHLRDLLDAAADQDRDQLAAALVEGLDGDHLPRAYALLKARGCRGAALAASRRMASERPEQAQPLLYLRDLLDAAPEGEGDALAVPVIEQIDGADLPRARALLRARGCPRAALAASRRLAFEQPPREQLQYLQELLDAGAEQGREDIAAALVEQIDGTYLKRARSLLRKHGLDRAALIASRRMTFEQPGQSPIPYVQAVLDTGAEQERETLAVAAVEHMDEAYLPRVRTLLKKQGYEQAALAASRRLALATSAHKQTVLGYLQDLLDGAPRREREDLAIAAVERIGTAHLASARQLLKKRGQHRAALAASRRLAFDPSAHKQTVLGYLQDLLDGAPRREREDLAVAAVERIGAAHLGPARLLLKKRGHGRAALAASRRLAFDPSAHKQTVLGYLQDLLDGSPEQEREDLAVAAVERLGTAHLDPVRSLLRKQGHGRAALAASRRMAFELPAQTPLLLQYIRDLRESGAEQEREGLALATVERIDNADLPQARKLLKRQGFDRAALAASHRMVFEQPGQARLLLQYLQDLQDGAPERAREELATAVVAHMDLADLARARALLKKQGFGLAAAAATRRMVVEQPGQAKLLLQYLQDLRDGAPEDDREGLAAALVEHMDPADLPRARLLLRKQGFGPAAAAAARRMVLAQPGQAKLVLQYLQDLRDGASERDRDELSAALVEHMDGADLPRMRVLLKKQGFGRAAAAASGRMVLERQGQKGLLSQYLQDLREGVSSEDRDDLAAAVVERIGLADLRRVRGILKKQGFGRAAAVASRRMALAQPVPKGPLLQHLHDLREGVPDQERQAFAAVVAERIEGPYLPRARALLKAQGFGQAALSASRRLAFEPPMQTPLVLQYLQDLRDADPDQDREALAAEAVKRMDNADLPRARALLRKQGLNRAALAASRRIAFEQPAQTPLLLQYLQDLRDAGPDQDRETLAAEAVRRMDGADLPRVRSLLRKQGLNRAALAASRRIAFEQPAQTPLLLQYLHDLRDAGPDQDREALAAEAVERMDGADLPRVRALLRKQGLNRAALAASRRIVLDQPDQTPLVLQYLQDLRDVAPDQDREALAAEAVERMDGADLPRARALLRKQGLSRASLAASRRIILDQPDQTPLVLQYLQDLRDVAPDQDRETLAIEVVERMDGADLPRARALLRKQGLSRASLAASRRIILDQPDQTPLVLQYLQDLRDVAPDQDRETLAIEVVERMDGADLPRARALLRKQGLSRAVLAASRRLAAEQPAQLPLLRQYLQDLQDAGLPQELDAAVLDRASAEAMDPATLARMAASLRSQGLGLAAARLAGSAAALRGFRPQDLVAYLADLREAGLDAAERSDALLRLVPADADPAMLERCRKALAQEEAYAGAMALSRRLLAENPEDLRQVLRLFGELKAIAGAPGEAEMIGDLLDGPYPPSMLAPLAKALRSRNFNAAAAAVSARLVRERPDDLGLLLRHLDDLHTLGRSGEELGEATRRLLQPRQDAASLRWFKTLLARRGYLPAAVAVVDCLLAQAPLDPRAILGYLGELRRLEDPRNPAQLVEALVDGSSAPLDLQKLAAQLRMQGYTAPAAMVSRRVALAAPHRPIDLVHHLEDLAEVPASDADKARSVAEVLDRIDDPDQLGKFRTLLTTRGFSDAAAEADRRIGALLGDDPPAGADEVQPRRPVNLLDRLAELARDGGEPASTAAAAEHVAAMDDEAALVKLGNILRQKGFLAEVVAVSRRLVQVRPDNLPAILRHVQDLRAAQAKGPAVDTGLDELFRDIRDPAILGPLASGLRHAELNAVAARISARHLILEPDNTSIVLPHLRDRREAGEAVADLPDLPILLSTTQGRINHKFTHDNSVEPPAAAAKAAKADGNSKAVPTSTLTYRNPPQLELLCRACEGLVRARGQIRLHVFAESTGEEVFTLVIELYRRGLLGSVDISASDVEADLVEKARGGEIDFRNLLRVPQELREACFERTGPDAFRLIEPLRARVHHTLVDLTGQLDLPGLYDVILMQNLLPHLPREKQDAALRNARSVQRLGGVLAIGGNAATGPYDTLLALGYEPDPELAYEIYESWELQRKAWKPADAPYWSLPPIPDGEPAARYASVFRLLRSGKR